MVHSPCSSLSIGEVLAEMRPGDILTHCFHSHACGIVGRDGRVPSVVRKKVEEGLRLDVGHGRGSFTFEVARSCMGQGVLPDTISSDLHVYNLHGPAFDLVTTINKFLHLGMELGEALRRVTTTPARVLGMSGEIGTLRPGAWADLVALEPCEGEHALTDSSGRTEVARRWVAPRVVIRGGAVVDVLPRPESSGDYFGPPRVPPQPETSGQR